VRARHRRRPLSREGRRLRIGSSRADRIGFRPLDRSRARAPCQERAAGTRKGAPDNGARKRDSNDTTIAVTVHDRGAVLLKTHLSSSWVRLHGRAPEGRHRKSAGSSI
jgi:hypothetical protein